MKKIIIKLFSQLIDLLMPPNSVVDQEEEATHKLALQPSIQRQPDEIEFIWCLVGNIVEEHCYGEQQSIRRGTKHFSPGTKVYCFPIKWGDGYRKIQVIGHARKSSRFILVIIPSAHIFNWRLDKVYSPHVKRLMLVNHGWDDSERSRKGIEEMATQLNQRDTKIKN